MKKLYIFAAATLFAASMTAQKAVATFENEENGIQATAEAAWLGGADQATEAGPYFWSSGDYTFYTYMDNSWGAAYYYGFYASADQANTSTGFMEPYRSAKGGAYEGTNFAVWTNDYYGTNSVTMLEAAVVPGFFINNNAYTVSSMVNGDGYAEAFNEQSWLKVTCTGKLNNEVVKSIDIDLAANGKYIVEWTYVDLSELGTVDEIVFSMSGSDSGDYGLNTPAYFCLDNFGAAKPEGYEVPEMAEFPKSALGETVIGAPAQKIVRDGAILIIRNGKTYNMSGVEVK